MGLGLTMYWDGGSTEVSVYECDVCTGLSLKCCILRQCEDGMVFWEPVKIIGELQVLVTLQ